MPSDRGSIRRKHNVRWQHLSRMKDASFLPALFFPAYANETGCTQDQCCHLQGDGASLRHLKYWSTFLNVSAGSFLINYNPIGCVYYLKKVPCSQLDILRFSAEFIEIGSFAIGLLTKTGQGFEHLQSGTCHSVGTRRTSCRRRRTQRTRREEGRSQVRIWKRSTRCLRPVNPT